MAGLSHDNWSLVWISNTSDFQSKLAPATDFGVGFAILIVVLLSVLGNGLVLVTSYRRRHRMRDSELLCVNLAVVDFLGCVCLYPLSILSSFSHAWLGGWPTCIYYGLGCYIFGLCGMFTIAAISVIRYVKTCHGPLYGANIQVLCVSSWLLATAWSLLPLLGWGEYVPEPYGLSCTVAWRRYHSSLKDATYVVLSFAVFVLVPVLLIVASQALILRKLCRITYRLRTDGVRTNLKRTERRLSVMFFCISLGFVVAWSPYAIVSFLFIFHREEQVYMQPAGFVFPALFAKSSHIYNPLIYFYFNKAFRQDLRLLLSSLFPGLLPNRVGVHGAQPTAQLNVLPGIHIQLQEGIRKASGQGQGPRAAGGHSRVAPSESGVAGSVAGGVRGIIRLVKVRSSNSKSDRRSRSLAAAAAGDAAVGREAAAIGSSSGGLSSCDGPCQCCMPRVRVAPLGHQPPAVREFLPIST
ncbi:opsin 8, group member c [Engraulis encrasicolus]|uniref:opsin 8, group member c n=1 Tax=Engraulis encrasicolus TaxID=184585 RepID=UPI002FD696B3